MNHFKSSLILLRRNTTQLILRNIASSRIKRILAVMGQNISKRLTTRPENPKHRGEIQKRKSCGFPNQIVLVCVAYFL